MEVLLSVRTAGAAFDEDAGTDVVDADADAVLTLAR